MQEWDQDRATTPEKKEEILERIKVVWGKDGCKEMRLIQLIMNLNSLYDGSKVNYNTEDYDLVRMLESFYEDF